VAAEEDVDAIILGVGVRSRASNQWGKTSLEIMRRATCEVIVDKVPLEEEPMPTEGESGIEQSGSLQ
jgi:hypothetical protein